MKNAMWQTMCYQYGISDWDNKKYKIKSLLNHDDFIHNGAFSTDRSKNKNSYLNNFLDIIKPQLEMFASDIGTESLRITDVWAVKYFNGDFHPPHTHSSNGYSAILYLEYDEKEHTGTYFVNSITDHITDLTNYSLPQVFEGMIVIVPSNVLHFTYPNKSEKMRLIIGFDIKIDKI